MVGYIHIKLPVIVARPARNDWSCRVNEAIQAGWNPTCRWICTGGDVIGPVGDLSPRHLTLPNIIIVWSDVYIYVTDMVESYIYLVYW